MYNLKTYNVFIASPGDVTQEREQIPKIIDGINRTSGKAYESRFEPFMWERDGIPAYGKEAQDFIDEQAIDNQQSDCAIFILWHRNGSPTQGETSGWKSEFVDFVKQHKQNNEFPIMFFVKTAPINPRKIDGLQLAELNGFLSSFEGMYTTFYDLESFKIKVEKALTETLKNFDLKSKANRTIIK